MPAGKSNMHLRDFRRSHGGPTGTYATSTKPRENSCIALRARDNTSMMRSSLNHLNHTQLDRVRQQSITELRNPAITEKTHLDSADVAKELKEMRDIRDATTV